MDAAGAVAAVDVAAVGHVELGLGRRRPLVAAVAVDPEERHVVGAVDLVTCLMPVRNSECGRFSHVDFCGFSMVLESDFDGLQISVCCPNLRKNRLGELELNCFSRITDFTLYTELLMILFLLRMKFYN